MVHVDSQILDAFASSRNVRRRDVLHVDRCVTCRRAAAERGISDERIASMLAATRPQPRALVAASVLAVLVGIGAAGTPLRGAASGFFAIFEPHTVVAVPLTLDDMRSLDRMPDLSAYASTRELRKSASTNFADARAAASAAGFVLRQPAFVPSGIRATSYTVQSPSTQLMTFATRAAKAGASPLPPLPGDIVGSTLQIDLGATVLATYMTAASAADEQRLARAIQRATGSSQGTSFIVRHGASRARVGSTSLGYTVSNGRVTELPASHGTQRMPSRRAFYAGRLNGMPLVVVQMPAPRIGSTGVTVQRLASFMLDQPGVPPRVAAAFRALNDLSTTLPIPIPIDKAYTQPVSVDGVQGVGVGDDTGIGAAVIWQKNGMLYAVFATRPAREVLAIANSLR